MNPAHLVPIKSPLSRVRRQRGKAAASSLPSSPLLPHRALPSDGSEWPSTPPCAQCPSPAPIEEDLSSIVTLDVGGRLFRTRQSTLLAPHEPRSYFHGLLASQFSEGLRQRHAQDSSGKRHGSPVAFIDRDGGPFGLLLQWLRDPGRFLPPQQREERRRLWLEADYYGLMGLCKRLEQQEDKEWTTAGTIAIKVLDDTRYPQPPRRFDLKLPRTATWGQLRLIICALIGYEPRQFDLLTEYRHVVPRMADEQPISNWTAALGATTALLRARGYDPRNLPFIRPPIKTGGKEQKDKLLEEEEPQQPDEAHPSPSKRAES